MFRVFLWQMTSEIIHICDLALTFILLIYQKHLHIWNKSEMTHFTAAAFHADDARMTVKMQRVFNELWKRSR